MEKIKEALDFFKKTYGEDVEILSAEEVGNDVKIVWEEDGEEYFSRIGKGRFGKLKELAGG